MILEGPEIGSEPGARPNVSGYIHTECFKQTRVRLNAIGHCHNICVPRLDGHASGGRFSARSPVSKHGILSHTAGL